MAWTKRADTLWFPVFVTWTNVKTQYIARYLLIATRYATPHARLSQTLTYGITYLLLVPSGRGVQGEAPTQNRLSYYTV